MKKILLMILCLLTAVGLCACRSLESAAVPSDSAEPESPLPAETDAPATPEVPEESPSEPTAEPEPETLPSESPEEELWILPDSPVLDETVFEAFDRAFHGFTGATYTPIALLGTRQDGDTFYQLLCQEQMITRDAPDPTYAVVVLQVSPEETSQVFSIVNTLVETEGVPVSDPTLTEKANALFEKATERLLGVNYTPICVCSEETDEEYEVTLAVWGTVVYPGAGPELKFIEITENPDGSVESEIKDAVMEYEVKEADSE